MLQYCSVFRDGLCAAVRWRRCSQHVVHLVCGPLSHVLLLVRQPWAAFMLHGCFNVSTQAHLLSDYSTFCTCWHHFQAFLLCQLLFSASLLSRWFNIASLTLRSWQWGGQSMMTVLHWGGVLHVAWWLKLWWRFSKQQMDEGPDVFLRSCVGSLLFLRTCFQGEIKKLRGSLFPFKEAIKKWGSDQEFGTNLYMYMFVCCTQ